MKLIEMHPTRCPISGEEGDATEIYPVNFNAASLSPTIFSARRAPERIHFRIVRSNPLRPRPFSPVAHPALIYELYNQSSFDCAGELHWLKKTFGRYLEPLCARGCPRESLLEIGYGNGFFLERAIEAGFRDVRGVEPSGSRASGARAGDVYCLRCDAGWAV